LAWVLHRVLRLRGVRDDWRLKAFVVLFSVVLSDIEPVQQTLRWGQINILLMALVLLDLTRPAHARFRGFGVGLAAGIKLTPLIFLPYLLITKQWRAAAWAVAVFGATLVVGFAVFPSDSITFLPAHGQVGPVSDHANIVFNQAVTGPLARAAHRGLPPQPLAIILELVLAAAGLLLARRAHNRGEELLALLLVGLTGCAVSPISWAHHWVWFAPLVVWLGCKAATSQDRSRSAWAGAALALAGATFIWAQKTTPWANTDLPFAVNAGFCYWSQTDPVLAMISGSWYMILYLVILAGFWRFLCAKPPSLA
jgi:alpha-1,2-mannosyltransferase